MARSGVPWSSGSSGASFHVVAAALVAALTAAPAGAQSPGDVVINEAMIAAPSASNNREWFEIVGTASVDLQGCDLRKGDSDDAAAATTFDTIDVSLPVSPGQILLFARNQDWVVGDGGGAGDVPADFNYAYTGSSFTNGEPFTLFIVCGGTTVDSVGFDWREFEDGCPDNGCSVQLNTAFIDHEDNDDMGNWCLPPPDSTFVNSAGDTATGTPGEENVCLAYDWPGAGDVVFTELMIAPADTPEWFEIANQTEDEIELGLCTLRKWRLDDQGEIDESQIKEFTFGADGEPVTLGPGAVALFAYNGCIEAAEGDDDSADAGECTYGEAIFNTVSFTNSAEEYLALICPDPEGSEVVVDEFSYDMEVMGLRDGHSIIFDPASFDDPAAANDDRQNWCEASFSQCFLDIDGVSCNYGTPGEVGPCLADDVDWPDNGPACRCSSTGRGVGSAAAILLGLGLLLARSRAGRPGGRR